MILLHDAEELANLIELGLPAIRLKIQIVPNVWVTVDVVTASDASQAEAKTLYQALKVAE
jgi:hypothetical protein